MNQISKFSDRLNEVMKEKKINQTRLSELSNIPRTSIVYYCGGIYQPNNIKTYKLAETLGVSLLWLMGYDVPRNDSTLNEITRILESKSEDELRRVKEMILLLFPNN